MKLYATKVIWVTPKLHTKIFEIVGVMSKKAERAVSAGDVIKFLIKMRDEYFTTLDKEQIKNKLEGM